MKHGRKMFCKWIPHTQGRKSRKRFSNYRGSPPYAHFGTWKKPLLKTSKIDLMYSNSLARHFSSMFHAKCLLPRLDRLLLLRSCLQNFYQCIPTFPTALMCTLVILSHGLDFQSKLLSRIRFSQRNVKFLIFINLRIGTPFLQCAI